MRWGRQPDRSRKMWLLLGGLLAVGYWLLGLPVGWWLAFHAGWGGAGIWLGLVIGLAVVAGLLLARVAWISAGRGARLRLEEA